MASTDPAETHISELARMPVPWSISWPHISS